MRRRIYLASLTGSGFSALTGCISNVSRGSDIDSISGSWPTYRATVGRTGASSSTTTPNSDSSIIWEHSTKGVVHEPIVTRGQILVGTSAGKVISISARTGEREWAWTTDEAVKAPPSVNDDLVFVRSSGGIHALDINTGEVQWTHEYGAETSSPPAVLGPAPSYSEGVLYIVTTSGELKAYAGSGGEEQWTTSLPEAISATPAIGGGLLFATSESGVVYGIHRDNGETVWRQKLEEELAGSAIPVITDNSLIVATAGKIWRIEKGTGEIQWKIKPDPSPPEASMDSDDGSGSGPPVTTVPAVTSDSVVVGVNQHLYILDCESGDQRESIQLGSREQTVKAPTILGDYAFVSIGTELVKVRLGDGTLSRVVELSADGSSSALVDRYAFLGTEEGDVVVVG